MTKNSELTKKENASFLTDSKSFEHTWRVATAFAKSQMIPAHFQNKPEDCMVALMMAQQLEVNPILAQINWEEWMYGTGLAPKPLDFTNDLSDEATQLAL